MRVVLLTFFLLVADFALASPAFAITMSNANYILHWGTFNSVSGSYTTNQYNFSFTAGEAAPGRFTDKNNEILSGFQYAYSQTGGQHCLIPFSFSSSSSIVDFGPITPTNPIIRFHSLTLFNGLALGFTVFGYEDHPLTFENNKIPDTTCDNGLCSNTTASLWENTLTYGLGFRCDNEQGSSCSKDFTKQNYFKKLSDSSKKDQTQIILSDYGSTEEKAKITYKLNVARTQPPGKYINTITFIAAPTY